MTDAHATDSRKFTTLASFVYSSNDSDTDNPVISANRMCGGSFENSEEFQDLVKPIDQADQIISDTH